ncbi:RsmB/NOP family class I SAM-dependent RNA methyltransferase [Liquorilactobacillus capillatus]|uniref:23S rRNA m(5)C methyltransferase n=1 Tax=Liquorilactobacillus capillatus DSM 19910 TaxID=1423731 RepID=A0A0R1M4B8_9LACO|nr:RsmF rRNA methyltransferase first C-terminal domain-containing protein [Liquorilactobacillus capillatus]KRL00069.1 23S rRNA m(5)C methyltransferase [Liquorilactobacillus capillatus DSM 19910]
MNLPEGFISKYQEILGAEAPAFFESLAGEVNKGFRLNTLRENATEVNLDLSHPLAYVPTGYYGSVSGRSLEHQTGYVYSQEPSAMYVGEVAEVVPGERVLDLCAAPGGKSTQVAAKLAGEGLLVANEIDRKRAGILAENIERVGAANVVILNEDPHTLAQKLPGFFDKILVDAPCSGEGMFRKNPQAIAYWHPNYAAECAQRQRKILADAVKMLRPGGQLIYSTCTFAPEEDEQIVAWLLQQYNYFKVVPLKKWSGMDSGRPDLANGDPHLSGTVRLFPHHFKGEGHFIAKLQDQRPQEERKEKRKKKAKQKVLRSLVSSERTLWTAFEESMFNNETQLSLKNLTCWGEHLYWSPEGSPNLDGLRFLRPGLELGVFKKKRFEPSYALALYLGTERAIWKISLTHEEWESYVQGNTIPYNDAAYANGWYLLCCENKSFSFGKLVNGTIKNFFPKGLRLHPILKK